MSLQTITPQKARELIDQGALLVDIREADEHAREKIAVARHEPLSRLDKVAAESPAPYVIFHCKSGNRTLTNASRLACATDVDAYILEGGIDAWKKAGLNGLAGFVGAGLVFAGATGTCAMARILGFAPWNRRAATP